MTKLLQINITANWGSHGKMAEGLGQMALAHGWESHIAYGRWHNDSKSHLYHIGNSFDEYIHCFSARIFDNQGLMSHCSTRQLIRYIEDLRPDIIHLHNIHGYYLNYPLLFNYLSQIDTPVIWTLHDCWPFTGHCAHFMKADCKKWKTHCENCPLKSNYPRSLWMDRSKQNFDDKRKAFLSLKRLTLVPVSKWLEKEVRQSFFKGVQIIQVYNGINTEIFNIQLHTDVIKLKFHIPSHHHIILGIASNWYQKGLEDFIRLRTMLGEDYYMILIGLTSKDLQHLPKGIKGLRRTENKEELISLYSVSNVYFNPTHEDNFPTTILESMACGTPVVTYDVGGCREAISDHTGYIVPEGNLYEAKNCIEKICRDGKLLYQRNCRENVLQNFSEDKQLQTYFQLYKDTFKSS